MGINFSFLPFFDICHRQGALQNPMVVLGSQEIHETENAIIAFAKYHSYSNLELHKKVRDLFLDRYGVREYKDCDMNEKADIRVDLSTPIDDTLIGSAMVVLDAGTMEHIFDTRQVMKNIHDMTRVNGMIIHISPVSWFGHAYYNFDPRFFRSVMHANRYSLVAEAFHFPHSIIKGNEGAEPSLYITFDGVIYTPSADEVSRLFASSDVPANVLYMVAYKRTGPEEFMNPFDIQE